MRIQNIRFGKLETRALFALEEAEASMVKTADLARFLSIPLSQVRKVAWQLVKKKRLLRLKRGVYLFAPLKAGPKGEWSEHSFVLLAELMKGKPYYISFWSALNHYGLTEQIPVTVQVMVTRQQRNFQFGGTKYEFIHTRKLGEWREEIVAKRLVKIATKEQLLIDCLTHPQRCGGIEGVSKALWYAKEELDWNKLQTLAQQANHATQRRLAYLAEYWKLPIKMTINPTGWRWLDPSNPKTIRGKSVKWGLLLNVEEQRLRQWMES